MISADQFVGAPGQRMIQVRVLLDLLNQRAIMNSNLGMNSTLAEKDLRILQGRWSELSDLIQSLKKHV